MAKVEKYNINPVDEWRINAKSFARYKWFQDTQGGVWPASNHGQRIDGAVYIDPIIEEREGFLKYHRNFSYVDYLYWKIETFNSEIEIFRKDFLPVGPTPNFKREREAEESANYNIQQLLIFREVFQEEIQRMLIVSEKNKKKKKPQTSEFFINHLLKGTREEKIKFISDLKVLYPPSTKPDNSYGMVKALIKLKQLPDLGFFNIAALGRAVQKEFKFLRWNASGFSNSLYMDVRGKVAVHQSKIRIIMPA